MKIHRDIEQGTPEWHLLRAGRATASEYAAVLAKGKGVTRAAYLRKVVAERLTGQVAEGYRNAHMDRGQEQEPLARSCYEIATDHLIEQVAFIEHESLMAGCSPDGLVPGLRRGVEIKCVLPHVQVETVLAGTYPSEHKAQIQGGMWITGFEEWDFCSYSPLMPAGKLRTYVYTVKRDEEYIAALEAEVKRFLTEVDRIVDYLLGKEPDLEGQLRDSLKAAA